MIVAVGLTALTSACAAEAAASANGPAPTVVAPATTIAPTTAAPPTAAPTSAPPTTEPTTEPTTTSSDAPTTMAASPTTAPASTLPARAAVWESAVDPARINIVANHPIGAADGIASGIDMVAVTPADPDRALGRTCRQVAADAGVHAGECLVVQFRFDVEPGFTTHASAPHAELRRIRAVAGDGTEVRSDYGKWALAGTTDNSLTILLPGVAEGATIYWSTGSTLVGYTEFSGTVPGMIAPVDWLGQPAPATTAPATTPVTSVPATTAPPHDH